MYTYPAPPTGTAQDLMRIVTKAGELVIARDNIMLPSKTAAARALCEPPLNLAGALLRMLLEVLPADLVMSWHDAVYRKLAGGRTCHFNADSPALTRAAAEAWDLEAQTGRPPALVALSSHPPVLGETSYLNFEMVRHATLAARTVRGRPCRPRLVAAVDPFALDTAGLPAEGIYAGFMGLYHLGLDRLSLSRQPLSSGIVGQTAWPRFPSRLVRRLNAGGEIVMFLAGGVPATARVLYTMREWAAAQRRRSPRRGEPAEVLRRLREFEEFRGFEAGAWHGPRLKRCAWRLLEGWAMSSVAGRPWDTAAPKGPTAAETGILRGEELTVLQHCLEALGLSEAQRVAALAELAEEWPRQTPFRKRFFRVLAGRVLRRGRPVIFLPIAQQDAGRQGITIREAWSWSGTEDGRIRARILGETPRNWQGTAEEFAVEFGRENYS